MNACVEQLFYFRSVSVPATGYPGAATLLAFRR